MQKSRNSICHLIAHLPDPETRLAAAVLLQAAKDSSGGKHQETALEWFSGVDAPIRVDSVAAVFGLGVAELRRFVS